MPPWEYLIIRWLVLAMVNQYITPKWPWSC